MKNLLLTTITALFVADVSSISGNVEKNNEVCSFKDGNKYPTFLYNNGEQSEEINCTKETCKCDGSNTGYEGCQKCCCGIRERFEACNIVEKNEVKTNENDDGKTYFIWAVVASVICVLVTMTGLGFALYQKRQSDKYRQKIENLKVSLQNLTDQNDRGLPNTPVPNRLPLNGEENPAVFLTQRTVFPVVRDVPSETNPRVDQPFIGAAQDEMNNIQDTLFSVNNPPNSISATQDVSPSLANIQGDANYEGVDENAPLTI